MSLATWHRRAVSGEATSADARLARPALAAMSLAYGLAVRARNARLKRREPRPLPRPTASVGNLTAGGTGKTPVVAWLCRRLLELGHAPAVLTRGYRRKPGERGDEAELLAETLGPDVAIEIDPDRVAAANRVVGRRPDVHAFVLDDGFQHRRAGRDADLVLIDATCPFGFGHLLPRGLLREPLSSLHRATTILITRADLVDGQQLTQIESAVRRHADAPIFRSRFDLAVDVPRDRPVLAACGIGNPDAFFAGLNRLGLNVVETMAFDDHHDFTPADVADLRARMPVGGTLVVTGKDWVKLRRHAPGDLPVAVARQALVVDQADALLAAVVGRLGLGSRPATT